MKWAMYRKQIASVPTPIPEGPHSPGVGGRMDEMLFTTTTRRSVQDAAVNVIVTVMIRKMMTDNNNDYRWQWWSL